MSNEFVLAGERLRVRFFAAGDRYSHVISLGSEQQETLLESVEGTPTDAWPPSPVLQTCHLENLPNGRRVALLVGMAGRSHWSLAAELITENGAERVVFDVACRVSAPPEHLGNRYRLGSAVRWDRETGGLQLPLGMAQFVTGGSEAESEVRPAGSESEIDFVPRLLSHASPATIRWQFEITLFAQ